MSSPVKTKKHGYWSIEKPSAMMSVKTLKELCYTWYCAWCREVFREKPERCTCSREIIKPI